MPEGPECAATARSLDEFMNNKTIVNIEVLSGRYLKKKPEGLDKVRKQLHLEFGIGTLKVNLFTVL